MSINSCMTRWIISIPAILIISLLATAMAFADEPPVDAASADNPASAPQQVSIPLDPATEQHRVYMNEILQLLKKAEIEAKVSQQAVSASSSREARLAEIEAKFDALLAGREKARKYISEKRKKLLDENQTDQVAAVDTIGAKLEERFDRIAKAKDDLRKGSGGKN